MSSRKAKRNKAIKNAFKNINKGLKKTKIISSLAKAGVPMAGQYAPFLAAAAQSADRLGYGKKKKPMRKNRRSRRGGCGGCKMQSGGCKFN